MARDFNPADSGYNEVAARIVEARKKHPEGILRPLDPSQPYKIETIGEKTQQAVQSIGRHTSEWTEKAKGTAQYWKTGKTDNASTLDAPVAATVVEREDNEG